MSTASITETGLTDEIHQIVYDCDLNQMTQKSVLQRLEAKYAFKLDAFKAFIYERAVEEARLRIQTSPELQQQQHVHVPQQLFMHTQLPPPPVPPPPPPVPCNYYNTIFTTAADACLPPLPSIPSISSLPSIPIATIPHPHQQHHHLRVPAAINYQDVKQHYIGVSNKSHRNRIKNANDDDDDDDGLGDDATTMPAVAVAPVVMVQPPPSKRRKYNHNHNHDMSSPSSATSSSPTSACVSPRRPRRRASGPRTAQSTREADKDTEYELSDTLKTIMRRPRGTWRQCWTWLMAYLQQHKLRVDARKIRCDALLKQLFARDESSVSGLSRLLWKHLIGAMAVDERGQFKKMVYRKPTSNSKQNGVEEDMDADGDIDGDDEEEEEEEEEDEGGASGETTTVTTTASISTSVAVELATVPKKRRYRKKLRDEHGQVIPSSKRSGLTRFCFMSEALKEVVGAEGPMARNKITKAFWDYTERNGLKRKGRIIECDAQLRKIFGEDTKEVHMYTVQKGLKDHLKSMCRDEEDAYKAQHPHLFADEQTPEQS